MQSAEDHGSILHLFVRADDVDFLLPLFRHDGAVNDKQSLVRLPDRQPHMDHFVDGVWADYRLTQKERLLLGRAKHLHAVLVEESCLK